MRRGRARRGWVVLVVALVALATLSGDTPTPLHSVRAADAASSGAPPAGSAGVAPGAASGAASLGAFVAPWEVAGPFPSEYDLRPLGRVTAVRSQERFSTCPTMAALGSLESATATVEGASPDFSENNLANHMGSRLRYQGMMPSEVAAAYLARWEGPVLEESDPYPGPGRSPGFLAAARHVQQVLMLPRRTGPLDNAAVKWAVMTHGGVDAEIDFDTNATDRFWRSQTNAYYGLRDEPDHHVVCVGWDDDYPADSFAIRPPGDGAFLVKNSWGTDFGDRGYFWLSYYDACFGGSLAVFAGVEPVDNYDAVYQWDALGRSAWLGVGGGERAWYASRFVGRGDGVVTAAALYAPVAGTEYEIRVAASLAGLAEAPVAAAGRLDVAGYHTLHLSRPASVTVGRPFVIAAHVTTPGWTRPVPAERRSALINPRVRAGQSFVSADGAAWTDLAARRGRIPADVCLKAFVNARGAGDVSPPRVVLTGDVVRRGGVARLRWRLSDPSFSSASAIVVLSVYASTGVVATRRIPAAVVGERGVWRLRVDWPAGRYRLRGRAYDAAGNRQPRATTATLTIRGSGALSRKSY